jgi:hypothetical protein
LLLDTVQEVTPNIPKTFKQQPNTQFYTMLRLCLCLLASLAAQAYRTSENQNDEYGAPAEEPAYTYLNDGGQVVETRNPKCPKWVVSVKLCVTGITIHKSWDDPGSEEEWSMYVNTDATAPFKLNAFDVPKGLNNANHVINTNHCDSLKVDYSKVWKKFVLYSSGMERDGIFTPDERLPKAMTTVRFPKPNKKNKDENPMVPFQLYAVDSRRGYTINGTVEWLRTS